MVGDKGSKGTEGIDSAKREVELVLREECILCGERPKEEGFLLCPECWTALRTAPGWERGKR